MAGNQPPSPPRKPAPTRFPRPSLINIVLTCALFTVLATRQRPLQFIESDGSRVQHPFRPVSLNLRSGGPRAVLSTTSTERDDIQQQHVERVSSTPSTDKYLSLSSSKSQMQIRFDADLSSAARRARSLPPCAETGTRAKSFLMVFMGHSGSSAILSEVRSHPDVYMDVMELVDHQETFNSTAAALTTRRFFEAGVRAGKVPGFKMRPHHLLAEPALFRALIRDFDTRVLWQYRHNLFKASIGEYAVRFLRDARAVEGLRKNISEQDRCKHRNGCSFRIENVSFLHRILQSKVHSHNLISSAVHKLTERPQHRTQGRQILSNDEVNNSDDTNNTDNGNDGSTGNDDDSAIPCVRELPYEDYLYNREGTMKDIFRFLGLPWRKTIPQRFKATGDNLCKVVENWQEVCRYFYPCITWQHMLDDARNDCFCSTTGGPTTYCGVHGT